MNGIVVVPRRRTALAPHDPEVARRLFITDAEQLECQVKQCRRLAAHQLQLYFADRFAQRCALALGADFTDIERDFDRGIGALDDPLRASNPSVKHRLQYGVDLLSR